LPLSFAADFSLCYFRLIQTEILKENPMKLMTSLALLTLLSSTFASDCVSHINCGTFEGTGHWYGANGEVISEQYNEKIVITPIDKTSVRIKTFIYHGEPTRPWGDFKLVFAPSGKFSVLDEENKEMGTGICKKNVCNVAFRPVFVEENGESFVNAYVNTLRFKDGTLTRYNMVSNNSDDSDLAFQRSHLTKK
jgi:hypothetical protein